MTLVMTLVVVSPATAGGVKSLKANACKKGGWTSLVTTTGASFANQRACESYAKRGALKRPQTMAFGSSNPSPVTVGGIYTPTASATSGLPVAITVDPASNSVCSQSGAGVTFDAAGTCTIDANQAGDASYDAAPQVQQSITVTNPVTPSQAVCESQGGTFGTATARWTCKAIPDVAGNAFYPPLQNQCLTDGGVGVGAVSISAGTWDSWCFATATDVFLWVVGLTVQAAIIAAIIP
jgi:hypothetical protein